MMRVRFRWKTGEVCGVFENTPTAREVFRALPVTSEVSTWGEEVYFPVPVRCSLEQDAKQVVDPGTICFWVQGSSLALPYGPTPVSTGRECRLVTAVNVLGKLESDPRVLASLQDGDSIIVEPIEEA